jgi:hypothetical protein
MSALSSFLPKLASTYRIESMNILLPVRHRILLLLSRSPVLDLKFPHLIVCAVRGTDQLLVLLFEMGTRLRDRISC